MQVPSHHSSGPIVGSAPTASATPGNASATVPNRRLETNENHDYMKNVNKPILKSLFKDIDIGNFLTLGKKIGEAGTIIAKLIAGSFGAGFKTAATEIKGLFEKRENTGFKDSGAVTYGTTLTREDVNRLLNKTESNPPKSTNVPDKQDNSLKKQSEGLKIDAKKETTS